MTLQQIIEKESNTSANGEYGINACKESILSKIETNKILNDRYDTNEYPTSLYVLLEKMVEMANIDIFFNKTMIYACWLLINNK